jgi:hypothetical protein
MMTEAIGGTDAPAALLSLRERESRLAIERLHHLHLQHVTPAPISF